MKNTTRMAAGAGLLVLGALVAITPRYLFPVCEYFGKRMDLGMGKTMPMECYYTAQGELVLGLLISLIGIAVMLAARPEALRLLALVLGGVAAAVILMPVYLLPICRNPDMHCNQGTKPLLIVLGIITFIIAGWMGLSSRKPAVAFQGSVSDVA